MQFRDLKTQYNVLKDEMDKAILEVVASSAYVMGPKIKEMEAAFAEYVGMKHCIACNSGTDALLLALKSWDVKPGDAVFVPSFTFFASAEVIAMQGATPVFVDVDKDSTCLACPPTSRLSARWLTNTVSMSSKTAPKALEAASASRRPAPSVTSPPPRSSPPSQWAATVTAVPCSPTTTNGRNLLTHTISMVRAATVTTTSASA